MAVVMWAKIDPFVGMYLSLMGFLLVELVVFF